MDSGAFPLKSEYPVAIVGAGPVGLTTALALSYFEIPFVVFETNAGLSTETKAGTTLIRTLEVWQRFGAADRILSKAMRVDEIGDIERATNRKRDAVKLHLLRDETRFPFVINLPQSDMEPALRDSLAELEIRKDPSSASPHRLHAACGPRDARARHAGRPKDIRRQLSSGLRRRTQHGA